LKGGLKMEFDKTHFLLSNGELFDSTLSEFCSKNFEFASLNEIIKTSNFNKGSFYYRFQDKFDLYCALLMAIYAEHHYIFNNLIHHTRNSNTIRSRSILLLESLSQLSKVNHKYPLLLRQYYSEEDEFKNKVKNFCSDSVFDRYINFFRKQNNNKELLPNVAYQIFLKQMEIQYYLSPFIDFLEEAPNYIVTLVESFLSILKDNDFKTKPNITREVESLSVHKDNKEPSFKLNPGEFLLLFGPRNKSLHNLYITLEESLKKHFSSVIYASELGLNYGYKPLFSSRSSYMKRLYSKKTIQAFVQTTFKDSLEKAKMYELLEEANLIDIMSVSYKTLHDSMKIKFHIVYAMVLNPKLLILDNVNSTLNGQDKALIYHLLLKFHDKDGTIIMITNHLDDAIDISNQVGFIVSGKIHEIHSANRIKEQYMKRQILVTFLDQSLIQTKIFEHNEIKGPLFHEFIQAKDILEISTISHDSKTIYHYETGVDYDETVL
jgi:energy-coupling factor transporter ATP-binding protein EcfA2/AcrR family transcriptional regulator